MEQSLPIAANLLYQQASIVSDIVLHEQRTTGKIPDIPMAFQRKFYAFPPHQRPAHGRQGQLLRLLPLPDGQGNPLRHGLADRRQLQGHALSHLFQPHALPAPRAGADGKHDQTRNPARRLLHLLRAKDLRSQYSKMAVNLAMDVVVNTYLDHLPPFSTTLAWVNMNYSLLLKPFESLEYYVDKIQSAPPAHGQERPARIGKRIGRIRRRFLRPCHDA